MGEGVPVLSLHLSLMDTSAASDLADDVENEHNHNEGDAHYHDGSGGPIQAKQSTQQQLYTTHSKAETKERTRRKHLKASAVTRHMDHAAKRGRRAALRITGTDNLPTNNT